MVTPGLLPEADDHRPSPLRWILLLAFLTQLGLLIWAFVQLGKAGRDVAALRSSMELERAGDVARIRALEAALAGRKPAELRILPAELAAERLTQGLHEFRSGRYGAAEACFLRAVPEGYLYLVPACLARGDAREAAHFLGREMEADRGWLRRIRPRDLFGSGEEFERTLKALEERGGDAEGRLLQAYLQFHEKGPEAARALLGEEPRSPSAGAFLDALERP